MRLEQQLFYEESSTRKCHACLKAINGTGINDWIKNPITQRQNSVFFHVKCYTPRIKLPYSTKKIENPEVLALINEWNLQFIPPDINKLLPNQKLSFIQNHVYPRLWIEVLKYLTIEEISIFASISKEFYNYSWNLEIWKGITKINGIDTRDIKLEYLTQKFNTCVSCGEQDMKILYKNLLLNRCLCHNCHLGVDRCRGSYKYCLKFVNDLLKMFRIDRCFLERNNIPILIDGDFCHRTYPILIVWQLEKKEKLLKNKDKKAKFF